MNASPVSGAIAYAKGAFRQLVLGPADFPHSCALGMPDPQCEVRVWLESVNESREVTYNNVMVAARPLAVAIGLNTTHDMETMRNGLPLLRFTKAEDKSRVLGEIYLRLKETVPLRDECVCVFEALDSKNRCVSTGRLWIRELHEAYRRSRAQKTTASSTFRMRASDLRSVFVFYICPRPVVLVSVSNGHGGNIFPMDLVGPVGTRHFALALHHTSAPLQLMEQTRKIAVSSVPWDQCSTAYALGKNHNRQTVDFDSLPFATTASTEFRLPVPLFSSRIREMQIEIIRKLESHTLFIATPVTGELRGDGLELCHVHGSYQAWRQRHGFNSSQVAGVTP